MNRRRIGYYDLPVHAFVAILLISTLVGQKITAVGPFRISGAQLFFPITYIFGDFTEALWSLACRPRWPVLRRQFAFPGFP